MLPYSTEMRAAWNVVRRMQGGLKMRDSYASCGTRLVVASATISAHQSQNTTLFMYTGRALPGRARLATSHVVLELNPRPKMLGHDLRACQGKL